uniref:Kringle-containing protein marking the eye and the nose n=1 Tax=Bos taurus TaxID=9913 RepID=A0AAA9SUJ1_BOVIN
MAPPAARLALLSAAALTLAARPAPSPGLGPGPECFTANGADYRGTQNWTALQGGKPCLFWNETFQHPYNTLKYPNGEGGVGEHNYCRNPDGDVSPWCYVAEHEDGVYWKYCEIPTCQMPGNLGCYKDHGNPPPLTGTSKTSNKLTIQNCISFCRSQRFKFAGIESGYACFCGNDPDYWKYGEAASTECSSVCFGDHTQPCGGDGRVIVFDTLVGACGGNYSAMTSVVYSPDFPDAYAAGRVCYWTIRVPGAAHIQFNFTLFDIRDSADMVELLDGYTHRVLVRFNGRNRPPSSFNISLDFIILYFFSDRINQAQGFAVLYQAIKEDPPQEKPTDNQMLAEVITEQANFSVSAARSSKVLYVITTSPSHPRQTVPGWTVYGLATLLILTVTAIVAKILLHITFRSHRVPASGDLRDCHQPGTSGEIWSIFYEPSTSISIFKKKLKCQSQPDDRNPLVQPSDPGSTYHPRSSPGNPHRPQNGTGGEGHKLSQAEVCKPDLAMALAGTCQSPAQRGPLHLSKHLRHKLPQKRGGVYT